jgi:tRNA (guanine-N7-)-methyltransferase
MYEAFHDICWTARRFCLEASGSGFSPYPKKVLEIGFGNGDFLVHLAESSGKETLVVGMEVSAVCVLKAAKRLSSGKISNARVVLGDARYLLEKCVPPSSLSGIYMNFPCPWPKNRHAFRRVTEGNFPESLSRTLVEGGRFSLVTDEEWYALEAREKLSIAPQLEFFSLEVNPTLELTTKYASKWKALGKNIYRLTIQKKSGGRLDRAAKPENPEETMAMHSKLFISDLKRARQKTEELVGTTGGAEKSHWSFKAVYWSSEGHALLKTITSDEGFEQTFFFRLVFLARECLVKLEDAGAPLHTPAVRLAMEAAVRHLSDDSGLQIQ